MGDLQSLAQSIQRVGLLQAIGVTPSLSLVFGERRLRACQELGWENIPARTIDIPAIALGEYHENCDRKDFTPSELVAIVESLRGLLTRRGIASPINFAIQTMIRRSTRARELVGLKKDTFCRAKRVVEQGVPELVEAMDSGKLSVFAASELAVAGPEDQRAFLEHRPNEQRWTGLRHQAAVAAAEDRRAAGSERSQGSQHARGQRYDPHLPLPISRIGTIGRAIPSLGETDLYRHPLRQGLPSARVGTGGSRKPGACGGWAVCDSLRPNTGSLRLSQHLPACCDTAG